ncbi:hypothetical protein ACCS63_35910, partial [Rhizobium brockwellii]|uniref:hypothetical protein n=1 Tax=Rhizobium brockwellii TaxID=3019932 RepID=UPI003F985AFD
FFGVVYAGAWPVPLPLPTSFGGRDSYIEQLRVQLASCDPKMLIFPPELAQRAIASGSALGSSVSGAARVAKLSQSIPSQPAAWAAAPA